VSKPKKLPVTVYCANKNGALWLPFTAKVFDFCEQKIFLDDNSTDSSVKIAEELGWDIYHWTGRNSMSERRNYAIGFLGNDEHKPEYLEDEELMKNIPEVRHEWIIQLDSDEEWEYTAGRYIKNFLESNIEKHMNTISIDLLNMQQGNKDIMGAIPLPRMYRKGTIWWTKDIQNNVEFSLPVGSLGITVRHHGYADPEYQWIKQWDRLPMLEDDLRNHPKDFERRKYLINVLSVITANRGDAWEQLYGQCTIAAEQFLDNKGLHRYKPSQVAMQKIMRFLWSACTRTGMTAPFVIILNRVWDYVKFHPDPWFWMFAIFRAENNHEKVIEYGEEFFKAHHKFEVSPQMVEITTYSKRYEVAEMLQFTYDGLAETMKDTKLRKKYKKRAEVWAKKKLEYWMLPEKEERNADTMAT